MKRDFLALTDMTRAELEQILESARRLKADRLACCIGHALDGMTVAMIFHKPSMRTRVSFEVGIRELGGSVLYMGDGETALGQREPISHVGRVLSRYLHALVVRTFAHSSLEELAAFASIPVVNALTDKFHPCQVLADLLTVLEHKGRLDGLRVAWVGDGNNMANSWLNAAYLFGFDLALAVPEGYDPAPDVLERARSAASVTITHDPFEAVEGADVVNTDVWASMGQESEAEARKKIFRPYQVNGGLMKKAAQDAIVLHCLPAHLGDEITEDVLEGPQSVVFDQAENRLHAQKAMLEFLLAKGRD